MIHNSACGGEQTIAIRRADGFFYFIVLNLFDF